MTYINIVYYLTKGIAAIWLVPVWLIFNLLLALDQLANVLIFGDPDETISSRFGKRRETCRICDWVCYWLDKLDANHCAKSIETDEGGKSIAARLKRHFG